MFGVKVVFHNFPFFIMNGIDARNWPHCVQALCERNKLAENSAGQIDGDSSSNHSTPYGAFLVSNFKHDIQTFNSATQTFSSAIPTFSSAIQTLSLAIPTFSLEIRTLKLAIPTFSSSIQTFKIQKCMPFPGGGGGGTIKVFN